MDTKGPQATKDLGCTEQSSSNINEDEVNRDENVYYNIAYLLVFDVKIHLTFT